MIKKIVIALAVTAILAVLSLVTLQIVANSIDEPTPPVAQSVKATAPSKPTPPTVDELLRLVNEERAKVGVAPLVIDPLLNQSAQMKSDDMALNNYFGHVDANGKHGWDYINDVNKRCTSASENIVGVATATGAIDWWMGSDSHRLALQDPKYESTGIGISYVNRIPLANIVTSKPVYTDMINTYVITEHFCDER